MNKVVHILCWQSLFIVTQVWVVLMSMQTLFTQFSRKNRALYSNRDSNTVVIKKRKFLLPN